jgi:carbon monoxide dehydrogenase subunit G
VTEASRTRTIARPSQDVWNALADFGGVSAWAPNADHSCLQRIDGHSGGSGIGVVRRIQTGRMTLLEEVVIWDEPTTLGYQIEGLPPVVRSVRNEWRLEPVGAAATKVTLTSFVDCGPRPPQQLIARIVARRLAKESDSMLGGLAGSLESERGRATSLPNP